MAPCSTSTSPRRLPVFCCEARPVSTCGSHHVAQPEEDLSQRRAIEHHRVALLHGQGERPLQLAPGEVAQGEQRLAHPGPRQGLERQRFLHLSLGDQAQFDEEVAEATEGVGRQAAECSWFPGHFASADLPLALQLVSRSVPLLPAPFRSLVTLPRPIFRWRFSSSRAAFRCCRLRSGPWSLCFGRSSAGAAREVPGQWPARNMAMMISKRISTTTSVSRVSARPVSVSPLSSP